MAPCQQPLNILSHHFPVGLGEVPSLLQRRWGLAQSGPWSWDFPLRLKRGCKYPGVTNSGVQHRGGASSFLRAGDACSASRLSRRRNIPSQHSPAEAGRGGRGQQGTGGTGAGLPVSSQAKADVTRRSSKREGQAGTSTPCAGKSRGCPQGYPEILQSPGLEEMGSGASLPQPAAGISLGSAFKH